MKINYNVMKQKPDDDEILPINIVSGEVDFNHFGLRSYTW